MWTVGSVGDPQTQDDKEPACVKGTDDFMFLHRSILNLSWFILLLWCASYWLLPSVHIFNVCVWERERVPGFSVCSSVESVVDFCLWLVFVGTVHNSCLLVCSDVYSVVHWTSMKVGLLITMYACLWILLLFSVCDAVLWVTVLRSKWYPPFWFVTPVGCLRGVVIDEAVFIHFSYQTDHCVLLFFCSFVFKMVWVCVVAVWAIINPLL